MKINKLGYILIFLCGFFVANATEKPISDIFTKEEIVAFGKNQLEGLIAINELNRERGEEFNNNYVFFTKNIDLPLKSVKEFIWGDNYAGKESQLEELNTKLKEINTGLKAPLYLGVNLDMGRIDLTTRVNGYSTVATLQDLQKEDKEQNLKELLSKPVNDLYKEINKAITSSLDNPITINSIGFFQLTYTKGKIDEIFVETWSRQMMVMKHFDEDPTKAKKRASIIKEALRKDKLGISLTADKKNIDLVKSKNYFERYKAAINGYWSSDLNRFNYDYSYDVANIANWYTLDLQNKETGVFDPKANKSIFDYTGLFFTMKSDVGVYLTNFTNINNASTKIVITDDFTNDDRLQEIEKTLTNTKDAGAIVWIHVSKDNEVVKQNLYKKGYKLTLDPALSKRLEDFGKTVFKGNMDAGKALATLIEMDAILTQFGSVVFGGITNGLNAVKLPKEFWDTAAPNYCFKDLNTWVKGTTLEPMVLGLQNNIAFLTGVYNGFISTTAFITGTVDSGFKLKAFIKKMISDSQYRDLVFRETKEVADLIIDDASREAVWTLATTLVAGEIEKGWDYEWKKIENNNFTGAYYFAGNITFEIVVAVLSGGASAEAGIAKEFLAVLKWATDPLEFVIKRGKKFAAPVAKLMTKGFKIATDGTVQIGNKILFRIDIGTSKIVLMADATLNSLDPTYSEVLQMVTPDEYPLRMDGSSNDLGDKILKIVKNAQGTYKVLLEDLDAIVKLAEDLKDAFGLSDINKAKKLAKKLGADNIAKLIAKADVINKADDPVKLIEDIANTPDFAKYIDELDDGIVDAWKYVNSLKTSGLSKLSKDIDALKIISKHLNDENLMSKIGRDKYDNIVKNYAGQCKTCDPPSSSAAEVVKHLPPLDEMLENLATFVNKHHGKDGFDKVIADLQSTDPRKQKGAEYISRILKDEDGVSAFEFKYLNDLDNTADFVLSGTKVDGKSWSVTGSIDRIGGWDLSKQLKDYFKDGNFEQWFDYSRFQKSSNATYSRMTKNQATSHIKQKYQKLFEKESKAQELFDYITDNGENIDRFENLFGENISSVDEFIDEIVSDLSNQDLYGFIKVK